MRIRHRTPEGGPPDFVGVGTSDSGWRWWHGLLLEHPGDCAAAEGHSLEFFEQFCKRAMTEEDIRAYHARFTGGPRQVVGEWSPDYMYEIWTPMLLHRAAPDAKLLVMLVDPSAVPVRSPTHGSGEAASERRNNRATETDFLSNSLPRGRYLTSSAALRFYPATASSYFRYERCVEDPLGEYARTLRFLGVDDDFRPDKFRAGPVQLTRPMLLGRAAPHGEAAAQVAAEALAGPRDPLLEELEPDVRELGKLVPDLDLSLWPSFTHLATASETVRA